MDDENKPIILIDIHDVGNRILGRREKEDRERKSKITKVIISNAPDEETGRDIFGTAPDYFMKSFAEILAKNLEIDTKEVKINHPYKGGNIIRQFGNPYHNSRLKRILEGKQIFAIQVEFNRGLYLNETNQRPYTSKIRFTRNALMKTLKQLCEFDV
jgi:N-formylglutamate amidohydrolase